VDVVSVLQLGGGGTWSVSLVFNQWPEKKKNSKKEKVNHQI
jgi:hypothetical protein